MILLSLFAGLALAATASHTRLRTELLAMDEADQTARSRKAPDWDEIEKVGRRNAARLAEIIEAHGWPGATLVGRDAAHSAWLVAQHADHDPSFQRKCLVLIESAVRTSDATKTELAYLTDRVRVAEGRRQVYGTQTEQGRDGRYRPKPVEDASNLDRRRKSVGLMSERKYLRLLEKLHKRR